MAGKEGQISPPQKIRTKGGASISVDDQKELHYEYIGATNARAHVSMNIEAKKRTEIQKWLTYNAFNRFNQNPLTVAKNVAIQPPETLDFKDSIIYVVNRIKKYKEAIVKTLKSFNERARFIAEKINDNRVIFYLYAILDSLSLSYSFIKYLFDVILESNNSYTMHHLMLTPAGIASIVVSSCYLIAYSLFNTYFEMEKVKSWHKNMADLWPYIRDIIQALKNGYKGMRSVIRILAKFAHDNLESVILPLALTLGMVTVLNRLWLRYMRNERKELMKANQTFVEAITSKDAKPWLKIQKSKWSNTIKALELTDITDDNWFQKLKDARGRLTPWNQAKFAELESVVDAIHAYGLTPDAINALTNNIEYQAISVRILTNLLSNFLNKKEVDHLLQNAKKTLAYLSVTLNGMMDGAYLYLGVLGVASLVPPALIVMLTLCAFYTVLSITARLYEEYTYQVKLHITQTQCELALLEKQLKAKYLAFQDEINEVQKAQQREEYRLLLEEFNKKTKLLREQSTVGYIGAFLSGINIGLGLYSAVVSIVLLVGTILSLSGMAFPPALLIACISLGVGCLLVCIAYSLIAHYVEYGSENIEAVDLDADTLLNMGQEEQGQALSHASHYVAPTASVLPSYIELLRSFFSGFKKGQTTVDYALNPFQEADSHGDFRDPKWMYWVGVSMGAINGLILSLRAFAKELGRDKLRFDLEVTYSEKPQDTNIKKNTLYLYTENNKIMFGVKDREGLIQKVEFKREDIREKLDCTMYNNIYTILSDPTRTAQLNDKEEEEILAAAWRKGYIVESAPEKDELLSEQVDNVDSPEPRRVQTSPLRRNSLFKSRDDADTADTYDSSLIVEI